MAQWSWFWVILFFTSLARAESQPGGIDANRDLAERLGRYWIDEEKNLVKASQYLKQHLSTDPGDAKARSLLERIQSTGISAADNGSLSSVMLNSAGLLSGSVVFKGGYNTNPTLLPDSTVASQNPASPSYASLVSLSYDRAVAQGKMTVASTTAFSGYTASGATQSNSLSESFGLEWSPNGQEGHRLRWSGTNRLELSFANANGLGFYSWSDTLGCNLVYAFNSHSKIEGALSIGYQGFPGVELLNENEDRAGWLITASPLYRRSMGPWSFSGGLSFQEQFSKGSNYKSFSFGLVAGASRSLIWKTSGKLGISATRQNYSQSESSRSDNIVDLSLDLSRPLALQDRMLAGLAYMMHLNLSNLDSAKYRQNILLGMVTYAFN